MIYNKLTEPHSSPLNKKSTAFEDCDIIQETK
jgi:hypothetical protein